MEKVYQKALQAIVARIQHDFVNPALNPYRKIIKADAGGGAEQCAVDCEAIAAAALTMGGV